MSEQMWIVFICGIVFGFVPPLALLGVVRSRFWRDGDDEEASCEPAAASGLREASRHADLIAAGPPWPEPDEPADLDETIVPWTDTQEHLAELAASYYEGLSDDAHLPRTGLHGEGSDRDAGLPPALVSGAAGDQERGLPGLGQGGRGRDARAPRGDHEGDIADEAVTDEPLARVAGADEPPVTTAPCSAGPPDTVKGDSPGPGLPPPFDTVMSTIFDQMITSWPSVASAPPLVPGPPPGELAAGAEPELAGTVVRTDEDGDAYCVTCGHYPAYNKCGHRCCTPEPPAPERPRHLSAATSGQRSTDPSPGVDSSDDSGAGADPWDLIAAGLDEDPELNEWSIKAEAARCADIRRELAELGKATAAWRPALTEWR